MKTVLFITSAFLLAFCSNRNIKDSSATGNISDKNVDTLCYVRTEGSNNQDTTHVKFIINDNTVTGTMDWLPYEKDSRKGRLNGTRTDNIIKARWVYMQEGVNDSIPVEFKLDSEGLFQKKPDIDKSTGKEILPENADYALAFKKIGCN